MVVPTLDTNNKHLTKEKHKEHQYFSISNVQEEQN